MPDMPQQHRRVYATFGIPVLLGLLVGAWVIRPFSAGPVGFDSAASVIHFDRIISGQRLEAFVTATPKPLLTVMYGLVHGVIPDWRAISWLAIAGLAVALGLASVLGDRLAGPRAAGFAAIGVLGSAALLPRCRPELRGRLGTHRLVDCGAGPDQPSASLRDRRNGALACIACAPRDTDPRPDRDRTPAGRPSHLARKARPAASRRLVDPPAHRGAAGHADPRPAAHRESVVLAERIAALLGGAGRRRPYPDPDRPDTRLAVSGPGSDLVARGHRCCGVGP